MHYISTRNKDKRISFMAAAQKGLAEDGGLYVPQQLPDLSSLLNKQGESYPDFASQLLGFFISDVLQPKLKEIVSRALNFPVPMQSLTPELSVLELFHGPTLSFKDFGARFLAGTLATSQQQPLILVATSGDTGSAVASSFHGLKNVSCCVLFPKGKISQRQQAQITCWGDNILAIEVNGDFDACQALVKAAFADKSFAEQKQLSTANSINIGRLLPQMTYYAYHSCQYFHQHQRPINYIVPSGNLGNVTACVYAKKCGLPIGNIIIATNANQTVSDYVTSGTFNARPTIFTLANAMDVGAPSNFERLEALYDNVDAFREELQVLSINDQQIRQAIQDCYQRHHYLLCPHTATAYAASQQLALTDSCLVATAHPAKFEQVIEPILNIKQPVPAQLQAMLDAPHQKTTIEPSLAALKDALV